MADEHVPPDKESTPPDDQAEYDALVRKYGEGKLRIGQLESQVNSLTSRLDDRSTPGPGVIGAAPWLPSEYDGLVDRYGQAMLRVGRLESRMGDVFGPAEERDLEEVDGAASNAWPPELNGLMGRIEAMEGRLGAPPQGSRHRRSAAGFGRGSARETSHVPQRDEELAQAPAIQPCKPAREDRGTAQESVGATPRAPQHHPSSEVAVLASLKRKTL